MDPGYPREEVCVVLELQQSLEVARQGGREGREARREGRQGREGGRESGREETLVTSHNTSLIIQPVHTTHIYKKEDIIHVHRSICTCTHTLTHTHLLVKLQSRHWLVQFDVDLAEVQEHIHRAEVLEGRLEL